MVLQTGEIGAIGLPVSLDRGGIWVVCCLRVVVLIRLGLRRHGPSVNSFVRSGLLVLVKCHLLSFALFLLTLSGSLLHLAEVPLSLLLRGLLHCLDDLLLECLGVVELVDDGTHPCLTDDTLLQQLFVE